MFAGLLISHIDLEAPLPGHQICEYETVTTGFLGKPLLCPRHFKPSVAVSLEKTETRAGVLARLHEISKLGSNWDAYAAEPVDGTCLANARNLLTALPESIPSPEVFPNPNGTLTLDWESGDQVLSLELGAQRFSSFWQSHHRTTTAEGEITQEIPTFVDIALRVMFPDVADAPERYDERTLDVPGQSRSTTSLRVG